MIESLHIRGLGIIEEAELALAPGLTVVTGETGAGKTMLVTALGLLLGARADASLVRQGSGTAVVQAILSPPPPEAVAWIGEEDADAEQELIVSREIPASGRSRARIGGRLAPVAALNEVLGRHVEVHGQYEHVRLGRPDVQRRLLDRYAGQPHGRTLDVYRDAYESWRALDERRLRLEGDARERVRELDRLRHEVTEIEAARLDPERDGAIDHELDVLAHADALQLAAAEAAAALSSDGAQEPVGAATAALRRITVEDPELESLRERLAALAAEVAELAADLRGFGERVEADPRRLAELHERKRLLAQLQRKYGVDAAAVLDYGRDAAERLAALEGEEADAAGLDDHVAERRSDLEALAERVREGRRAAAGSLAAEVDRHLADLGMPHGRFEVLVEPLEPAELTRDGGDRVVFVLAPNPGEPARPLGQTASGGERSRVSLAVEVALADVDDASVLVFDEVDAGIGGATAMEVGAKLARLAAGSDGRRRQILCVTHLAQLAAFADVHHVVEKALQGGRTVTTARTVGDRDRVAELARMLGGDPDAAAGTEHARELLDSARAPRAG